MAKPWEKSGFSSPFQEDLARDPEDIRVPKERQSLQDSQVEASEGNEFESWLHLSELCDLKQIILDIPGPQFSHLENGKVMAS